MFQLLLAFTRALFHTHTYPREPVRTFTCPLLLILRLHMHPFTNSCIHALALSHTLVRIFDFVHSPYAIRPSSASIAFDHSRLLRGSKHSGYQPAPPRVCVVRRACRWFKGPMVLASRGRRPRACDLGYITSPTVQTRARAGRRQDARAFTSGTGGHTTQAKQGCIAHACIHACIPSYMYHPSIRTHIGTCTHAHTSSYSTMYTPSQAVTGLAGSPRLLRWSLVTGPQASALGDPGWVGSYWCYSAVVSEFSRCWAL